MAMNYFEEKLATFEQALSTFKEALLEYPSQLERDGAIQRLSIVMTSPGKR